MWITFWIPYFAEKNFIFPYFVSNVCVDRAALFLLSTNLRGKLVDKFFLTAQRVLYIILLLAPSQGKLRPKTATIPAWMGRAGAAGTEKPGMQEGICDYPGQDRQSAAAARCMATPGPLQGALPGEGRQGAASGRTYEQNIFFRKRRKDTWQR